MAKRGIILTHAYSVRQVEDVVKKGRYDILKVIGSDVNGWGLEEGWTRDSRLSNGRLVRGTISKIANTAPLLIVRTAQGDPASGRPFLHPEWVDKEIRPWYEARDGNIIIELGNEPNVTEFTLDKYPAYAYYLDMAIEHCREHFPKASIISPAPIVSDTLDPYFDAVGHLIPKCDYVGIHAYAHEYFDDDGQLDRSLEAVSQFGSPCVLSEMGVNGTTMSPEEKRKYYDTLSFPKTVAACIYFHFCSRGDVWPQYHLTHV